MHSYQATKWKVQNPIAISRLKPCSIEGMVLVMVATDSATGERYVEAEVDHILHGSEVMRGKGRNRCMVGCSIRFAGFSEDMDRKYVGDEFNELLEKAPLAIDDYV